MYPDIDILHRKNETKESLPGYGESNTITPPTLHIPFIAPIEVRIPVVEIRDRKNNQLITAIEILSPINKRNPGLEPYRNKRKPLIEAGIHLIEIDLIRRGKRIFAYQNLPISHYLATLTRANSQGTDIWTFTFRDNLPTLPVPLKSPDKDAILNLKKALDIIYERGVYELSLDYYKTPPPPAFSDEDKSWMNELLNSNI